MSTLLWASAFGVIGSIAMLRDADVDIALVGKTGMLSQLAYAAVDIARAGAHLWS